MFRVIPPWWTQEDSKALYGGGEVPLGRSDHPRVLFRVGITQDWTSSPFLGTYGPFMAREEPTYFTDPSLKVAPRHLLVSNSFYIYTTVKILLQVRDLWINGVISVNASVPVNSTV